MPAPTRFRFDKPARLLKAARERAGLSQAEIAGKMGASQSHVSKIEAGTDVRASTLANMARVLGYEVMLVPVALVPAVAALIRGAEGTGAEGAGRLPRYTLDPDEDEA